MQFTPTLSVTDFDAQRGRRDSKYRTKGGQVMREFVGKAAFATGGASGIGLALGRAFAEAGCKVMLADIEKAALDAAVVSFSGSGREIVGIVCDVADPASIDAAAEATFSAFGKVHILRRT
jgi:NAD(P)-dependent dehydrogenase (short-subunit alcohol dehydrogenase family)